MLAPPSPVKVFTSTSSNVTHLSLKESTNYANFLTEFELRSFKEMYKKLKFSSLITSGDLYSDTDTNDTESKVNQIKEMFRERSNLLYYDIVEAVKCSEIAQSAIVALIKRHNHFSKQAGILAEKLPNLADEIDCRLKLVQFQLQTLVGCPPTTLIHKRQIQTTEENQDANSENSPVDRFRQWLAWMLDEMNAISFETNDFATCDTEELKYCLNKQKELQVKIQQEGGTLLRAVRKFFKSKKTTSSSGRKRVILSSLEKRWHGLWISCLERQCRYEQLLCLIKQGLSRFVQSENDLFIEPVSKRQRLDSTCDELFEDLENDREGSHNDNDELSSINSDTIPFSENEYESFMDQTDSDHSSYANVVPMLNLDSDVEYCNDKGKLVYNRGAMVGNNEAILQLKEQGQWYPNGVEIVGQDVGYSSENSVHSSNDGNFTGDPEPNEQLYSAHDSNGNFLLSSNSTLLEVENNRAMDNPLFCSDENWSGGSSPCLQRRTRIQKSPMKYYYKMTPLDTDGATDTETPRSVTTNRISEDSMYVYTSKMKNENSANSSAVNSSRVDLTPRDLEEIMMMLDDGYDLELKKDNVDNCNFKQEVERFIREGTTWKPFAGLPEKEPVIRKSLKNSVPSDNSGGDASSELSVDEFEFGSSSRRRFHRIVSTVPPNSPLDAPQCNSKRRRKRVDRLSNLVFKFPSVAPKMPNSVSESAVMATSFTSNLSSVNDIDNDNYSTYLTSAYCTLPREGVSLGIRRKKLRAKRMPRSMSDGEHLPFLNLTACQWVSDSVDKSGDDSPVQGPEVPPCTPRNSTDSSSETERDEETCNFDEGGGESMILDEERIAGDGSSPSTEQSDIVWEWDDYKPLDHNECGAPEKSLDGATFTKFDDDYLFHIETLTCDSSPVSARTDTSDSSSVTAFPRLPPVGLSNDSDSELEEFWQIIKESQKTLRSSQHALRQQSVLQQNNWADLMKTSIKHVHCLQAVLRQIFNLNGKSAPNPKEYNIVTNLLNQWQELMTEIQNRQPVKDESWSALQLVMKKLGKSLQNIMEHLSTRSNMSVQNLFPTEALLHEINLLKELTDKLKEDRKELDQWVCGNIFVEQYCPELQNLAKGYVLAVDRCSNQLAQLEALHTQWLDWHNNDGMYKQLLDDIKQKIGAVNEHADHGCQKMFSDVTIKDIQAIYNDLEICEDRLNRLETMCNNLTSASGFLDSGVILDIKYQLSLYSKQLKSLKNEFDKLPDAKAMKQKVLTEIEDCVLTQRKKNVVDTNDGSTNDVSLDTDRILLKSFLWRLFSYSWPVQLIFILLICVGIYILQPFCCHSQNNWAWSFGPKLNYVRGPPPT